MYRIYRRVRDSSERLLIFEINSQSNPTPPSCAPDVLIDLNSACSIRATLFFIIIFLSTHTVEGREEQFDWLNITENVGYWIRIAVQSI